MPETGGDAWVQWDIGALNGDGGTGWTQMDDKLSQIGDTANPGSPGSWDPNNWGGAGTTHMRTLTYNFTGLGFDPTGATWAQFNISINSGAAETTGNFYIDNVQTVLVPEPGTLALLGVGVLAVALRRRNASKE